MTKVSVIIPVYKNLEEFTRNLGDNLKYLSDCQMVVVNDDPSTNLPGSLPSHDFSNEQILWINNKKNLGFAPSINVGIKEITGDHIMLLNSDVRLLDDSWRNSLTAFEDDPNLFAVSFAQREKDGDIVGRNELYFKGGLYHHRALPTNLEFRISPTQSGQANLEFLSSSWAECGSAIFRASVWKELGGLDEAYAPFYWEDVDISYRAKQRGWDVLFAPNILVEHHHESTTANFFKDQIQEVAYRNQVYFAEKHTCCWRRLSFLLYQLKTRYIRKLMSTKV